MDPIIKILRGLGLCWCFTSPHKPDRCYMKELHETVRPPVFWVMGFKESGKSIVARLLARASGYSLVQIPDILRQESVEDPGKGDKLAEDWENDKLKLPDEYVVALYKKFIEENYLKSKGFIIAGFPSTLAQGKLFEMQIIKADVVVYCFIDVNVFVSRMKQKGGEVSPEVLQDVYQAELEHLQKIYRFYEHKTLKAVMKKTPQQIIDKLVSDIFTYYGFRFKKKYM